jgi:hypothetical protein
MISVFTGDIRNLIRKRKSDGTLSEEIVQPAGDIVEKGAGTLHPGKSVCQIGPTAPDQPLP